MPLFKYTTQSDADKTAASISKMLAKAGAKTIVTDYDDEQDYIKSISFRLPIESRDIFIKLPCDWKPVLQILNDDPKVPNSLKRNDQAVRVAWRIVEAWVEAQLAIIQTRMVKPEQVFLPYVVVNNSGQTLFEKMSDTGFLIQEKNLI